MRDEQSKIRLTTRLALIALLVALCAGMSTAGCGAVAASADEAGSTEATPVDARLLEAQAELAGNEVESAQSIYAQIIAEQDDPPGAAYAGKALTDLLLLPGSPAATRLLVDHLGATSGFDAQDALYAEEGFLYWQVRGVPWNDDASYPGIRSLIADELPWSDERLSAFRGFFEGLDTPVDDLMNDLVLLADAMGAIEDDIERALDDPEFEVLYVPGRTFHYDELDLLLGRAELHMVASALGAMRGSIYFMAAYEHEWTLDEALGAQLSVREELREGWGVGDYALDYLDARLGRQVRDAGRLEEARVAFDDSLDAAAAAIRVGLGAETDTTIRWSEGDRAYALELVEFLEALRGSLHGPVELPGSTPKTSMDLSSFFDGGRTLDEGMHWFERVEPLDETGAYWQLSDAAVQAVFVDGVFEPGFSVGEGNWPQLKIGDERGEKFRQAIGGEVGNNVADAYLTTR